MKLYFFILASLFIVLVNKVKAIFIPNQDDTWNYVLGDEIDELV